MLDLELIVPLLENRKLFSDVKIILHLDELKEQTLLPGAPMLFLKDYGYQDVLFRTTEETIIQEHSMFAVITGIQYLKKDNRYQRMLNIRKHIRKTFLLTHRKALHPDYGEFLPTSGGDKGGMKFGNKSFYVDFFLLEHVVDAEKL